MKEIFGDIEFEIFLTLCGQSYEYLVLNEGDLSPGSDSYKMMFDTKEDEYILSGVFLDVFTKAFAEASDVPLDDAKNIAEDIYGDFGVEKAFSDTFNVIYNESLFEIQTFAETLMETVDYSAMATDYMRSNYLHVDVFIGDLKVEQISEHIAYQFFQLICDLGGALGLFFGASLLSFIETADFWFHKGCKK
ncbi:uncharacterized protein [Amphiura filiformis]|uniref:uncharacterized protein n=1 Tax=Amphiura filiformis TaxID=82378 RepID=UPI003B21E2F5